MMQDSGEGEVYWHELAEATWLKPRTKPPQPHPETLKRKIWDVLDKKGFELRILQILENLQLLEAYLWPGFDDSSSNVHALLIVLMVSVKKRQRVPVWDVFTGDPESFSLFFRRVLALSVDDSLVSTIRNHMLAFISHAFQSLDTGIVRKQCAPLVSISLWHHLHDDNSRESKFAENPQLRKAWRASARRFEAADDDLKARLRFERNWLFTMILTFLNFINDDSLDSERVMFCESFIEFLTDLESQLPTRRYVHALLFDLNILALIKSSPTFPVPAHGSFRDLFALLQHFMYFSIDEYTGTQLTQSEAYDRHCTKLARLQRVALKMFKSKLTLMALSHYGGIDNRQDIESHLSSLDITELQELLNALGIRAKYPSTLKLSMTRQVLLEAFISYYERRKTFQEAVEDLSVVPTDSELYEQSLLRNEQYDGSRALAIPKLNLYYLSLGDFLWRVFVLYRCESFFEIRSEMEKAVKRMSPRLLPNSSGVKFEGSWRMALQISRPAILEVSPPAVGFDYPAQVRAEITLDVRNLPDNVRREWDTLKPDDVIYLLAIKPTETNGRTNGFTNGVETEQHGIQALRTADIVKMLDENGKPVRDGSEESRSERFPRLRRLIVNLDASAFSKDESNRKEGKPDIYEGINLVVRRKARENNSKRVLESIRGLALTDFPIPTWFEEVFLGYGDPKSASYPNLDNSLASVDFRDTFVDWKHLQEALAARSIELDPSTNLSGPPFVLSHLDKPEEPAARPTKRRRREEAELEDKKMQPIRVSTYRQPNNGPYTSDVPKQNKIRFTPAQVAAILSGTQPGLTVIVGPPGTGKTDVATQIISNLYHDFPEQRTLMIAHSNQALNQLFQKITNLDIDRRHLLRLGHGEEDLETEARYNKHGRVESFLDNRAHLLAEVNRMALTLGAPGVHGNSCETASYFEAVYVKPVWSKFWDTVEDAGHDATAIKTTFPFYEYFANAPQPLFPPDAGNNQVIEIAKGCQRHISKIFSELEDIRPFEILRNPKHRANYLLAKEARIIAMTSTHAAMRRQEIADLGFHYENIVMEEAAQITEIENFIPLGLQQPKNGKVGLQRIVLCGDHLQNSPIVQNLAFRQYANLEQSMFLRLVRLGVPVINLDRQGRARSSIADLYRWRYENLKDLPNVLEDREYKVANAGFRHEYQFIDIPDYKGKGEMEPSPYFIQNLGEAEYAVAMFQYMRLLGYPASKISILTTYAGQKALIRDVLDHRCTRNRLFGRPRIVATVDKYQGEQNDYIILSLVRTKRVGYLRDIRRITVALSRARLGLYVLGRREVFESCYELNEAFQRLLQKPTSLMLVHGEMFPTRRTLITDVSTTEMTGVEHLGQYVFEITKAKMNQLGSDVLVNVNLENANDVENKDETNREVDESLATGDASVEQDT